MRLSSLVVASAAVALTFAGAGMPCAAATLVAATDSADLALPLQSHRDSTLAARAPQGGGFKGFQALRQTLRQIGDPNLNPGNAPGQGQNSGTQGVGQKSINGTSGLPNGIADMNDPQKNLFLDPSQIASGLASDGNDGGKFTPSLTSTNNFINFCLTRDDLVRGEFVRGGFLLDLTSAGFLPCSRSRTATKAIKTGSCNAVPMGIIAAATAAPASKFVNPKNLDVIPPNVDFTIQMAINNLETGKFVNAETNYFSGTVSFPTLPREDPSTDPTPSITAPQTTNAQGQIIGHSHVVIEQIDSLTSTTVTDPTKFAFFKGLNDPAQNGVLSATVPGGLPAGVYKMSSINAAANHQPALVGVAQHGSLDDAVYFTVSNDANANGGSAAGSASSSAIASADSSQATGRQRVARSSRSDSLAPASRQRRDHSGRLEKRLAALGRGEQH
ncbi:hypothetical protein JCM3774_001095 [Rhodotorula dairenensis]